MNALHLSIKNVLITILVVIGIISVLISYISGNYFFNAAREAQLYSLNRVIQVATREIVNDLYEHTFNLATSLSLKGSILKEFPKALKNKNNNNLKNILDDPFITGFVNAHMIELVKVRTYDLNLKLIAESKQGIQNLSQHIPDILYQKAHARKGVERMKAVSGLWQHNYKSYYSVLTPIGGLYISGYLEVVVNPVNNLVKLSEKMDSPISIHSGIDSNIVYYTPQSSIENLLPISYTLKTDSGKPAYLLSSYEDITQLSKSVNETIFHMVVVFISLVLIMLFSAALIFQLFLFKPVNLLLKEIKNITDGDITRKLNIKGMTEINVLADEFNKMAKEIQMREDKLTRLSLRDGLTQIANRRKFDDVLKTLYYSECRTKKPMSILMIDIDYFKQFNDAYGHIEGDACLKKVALALQASIYRPNDLVARYGGEEFAIILPDTPKNGEHTVTEKIMHEINKLNIPHSSSPISKQLTVSIGGYTLTPSVSYDPTYIVEQADKSLYLAKEAGRNQFILRGE